jgi:phosphate/sulfate permease
MPLPMKKRIYWGLGVGLVGLLLVQKETYWVSGTYLHDVVTSVLGAVGGVTIGFLIGCIVEKTTDERSRRLKVLCWLLVMAIFGSSLGFGKGVRVSTTLTVLASTLGIGLVIGLLQYFLQRRVA